jgi:hypothetical protein
MRPNRVPAVLSLVASLALVAACSSAAGTASPGATQGASATEAPVATAGGATAGPQATFDFGTATNLANLQSYKITMMITGSSTVNVESIVVNGANPAKQVTSTSGSEVTRVVEIGQDVWVDEGSGKFVKNALPKAAVDAMFQDFDPLVLMGSFRANPDIGFLQNVGTEQKNGVSATHYHADQNTQLPLGASPIPAGTVFDMWVANDGGYVVALEATGVESAATNAGTVQIELTNVNDPSLTVTPPA